MKFLKYMKKGFQKNGVWIEENMLVIKKEEWENLRLKIFIKRTRWKIKIKAVFTSFLRRQESY